MEIPAAEGERDEPDARLDEPSRQEGALAPLVAAVAIAEPGVFLAQVERPARRLAQHDRKRLAVELVEALHQAGSVDVAPRAVEGPQQARGGPALATRSTPAGSARLGTWYESELGSPSAENGL